MAPFLGVVAAEPAGDAPVSAIVSGGYGGNLVLRDLGVGSHLFLPVAKPGGRVWIGDVHALQGDGVVDQTAIETAAEDLDIRSHIDGAFQPGASFEWTSYGFTVVSTIYAVAERVRVLWGGTAGGITGIHEWVFVETPAGVHVTTDESFAGEPVEADVTGMQSALDSSLIAWLAHLKAAAESKG